METYQQTVDPIFDSLVVSAVVAAIPIVTLFVLLGVFKVKAPFAALASLGIAIVLAIVGWGMPPTQALAATGAGALYGVVPILWILVNAVWVYKLTVGTPWFAVLGRAIRAISEDLRILSIIVAFCFGALLESVAGFGAPVAISAAMLIAAGMKPLKAAMVSLLANTAPVAFGAMAAPIFTLNGVTGIPVHELAQMAGRQTPFIAALVPLVLVFLVDGKRGVRQTWPVAVVAGLVFGGTQFLTANFFAVELTDVIAAVATIAAVLLFLRFWRPAELVTDVDDAAHDHPVHDDHAEAHAIGAAVTATTPTLVAERTALATEAERTTLTTGAERAPLATGARRGIPPRQVLMAAAPYLVIVGIFSIAQIPVVKEWLAVFGTVEFAWPGLDVVAPGGEPAQGQLFHLDHLKGPGTLLFFAGLVTMALYRITPRAGLAAYGATVRQLRWTVVTVMAVLALSFVMNLAGLTTSLGLALASAGPLFAVLSPVIGWIGVALTGSDTSSNALFGQLQVSAAEHTGLPPVLMAAANSSAGVLGKMLSLQNLAVASAAVGLEGSEITLFRKLLPWSLGLLALITTLIVLQSTPVLGWMVP